MNMRTVAPMVQKEAEKALDLLELLEKQIDAGDFEAALGTVDKVDVDPTTYCLLKIHLTKIVEIVGRRVGQKKFTWKGPRGQIKTTEGRTMTEAARKLGTVVRDNPEGVTVHLNGEYGIWCLVAESQ